MDDKHPNVSLRGDGGLEFSKNRFFFYISKV